jgi:hypothetical protein
VLSHAFAGAEHVQNALAVGGSLGCTSGTGIIPQCAAAAEAWRRIEGQQGMTMSRLAVAAVRAALGLGDTESDDIPPAHRGWPTEPGDAPAEPDATVPIEMIPQSLRQRITHLHAELGYSPPER